MNSRTRSEEHEPDLVSLAVAAESLGVSVKTIRRRISDGTVRGYRVGRLIRIDMYSAAATGPSRYRARPGLIRFVF